MASTAAFTDQAKQDFLNGVHQPGDTYKVALYTASAAMDKTTTAYSSSNEITNSAGSAYTAGGATLAGFTVGIDSDTAYMTFTNPTWASSTLTGVVAALIYNSSRSNKAIAVLTFSSTSTSNGTFTLVLPTTSGARTISIA
jgi:hypothetical protein